MDKGADHQILRMFWILTGHWDLIFSEAVLCTGNLVMRYEASIGVYTILQV